MLEIEITAPLSRAKTMDLGLKVAAVQVPDHAHRYVLAYRRNSLYNDRVCASTDASGFLNAVEFASEDATPQIVLALAELGAKAPRFGLPRAGTPGDQDDDEVIRYTIDPLDPSQVRAANLDLGRRLGGDIAIDLRGAAALMPSAPDTCDGKGVCFRTSAKVPIRIVSGSRQQLSPTVDVDIVSQAYLGQMDLERAMLVEKVVRLGFTNGALTHVIVKKPSEALQAVKLPLAVVETLLAVPGNFFGQITGSSAALKSEVENRVAAERALETRMKEIAAHLNTGTSAEAAFQLKCQGAFVKS
ncbi:MAG: hypothetical protein KJZ80_05805 [Hyphomicrobiaceae bacterium]|nr:hypothetical protein [Hyphomicrobiaceae bacterium]